MERSDWKALTAEFRRRGYFTPNTRRIAVEFALHIAMLLGGTALFVVDGFGWLGVTGILLSAAGSLGVSTNAHTASHGAVSVHKKVNDGFAFLGYPLLLGLSATYWKYKHCVLHHPNPNIVGVDDDIDFMPFFALHGPDFQGASRLALTYYKYQWLVVPFAIAVQAFNMQRAGAKYLVRGLWMRSGSRASRVAALIDAACLLSHAGLFLILPALCVSPSAAVVAYLLRSMVLSYAVFAFFSPAHLPAEALCSESVPRHLPFAARQTLTTLNFRLRGFFGGIARFYACGLEFQIEHHLFPRIDHTRYGEMSADVRAYCQQVGLPYRSLGWGEALRKSFVPFYRPKQADAAMQSPTEDSRSAA